MVITPFMVAVIIGLVSGGFIGLAVSLMPSDHHLMVKARERRLRELGVPSMARSTENSGPAYSAKLSRWLEGELAFTADSATFDNLRLLVKAHEERIPRLFPSAAKYALRRLKGQGFHAALLELIDKEEAVTGATRFSRPFEAHLRHSLERVEVLAVYYRQNWAEIEQSRRAEEEVEVYNNRASALNQGWEPKPVLEAPKVNQSAYKELLEGDEK